MVEPSLTSALPVSKVCVLSCVRLGKGEGCSLDREGCRGGEGWGWEGRLGWALPSVGGSWGPWWGGVCVGGVFQAWAGSTGADGLGGGPLGSRTLSSAWQGDQGTPRVSGTAWVGNGRFHKGQCRGKGRR